MSLVHFQKQNHLPKATALLTNEPVLLSEQLAQKMVFLIFILNSNLRSHRQNVLIQ